MFKCFVCSLEQCKVLTLEPQMSYLGEVSKIAYPGLVAHTCHILRKQDMVYGFLQYLVEGI
jgi:hypothetical protein